MSRRSSVSTHQVKPCSQVQNDTLFADQDLVQRARGCGLLDLLLEWASCPSPEASQEGVPCSVYPHVSVPCKMRAVRQRTSQLQFSFPLPCLLTSVYAASIRYADIVLSACLGRACNAGRPGPQRKWNAAAAERTRRTTRRHIATLRSGPAPAKRPAGYPVYLGPGYVG